MNDAHGVIISLSDVTINDKSLLDLMEPDQFGEKKLPISLQESFPDSSQTLTIIQIIVYDSGIGLINKLKEKYINKFTSKIESINACFKLHISSSDHAGKGIGLAEVERNMKKYISQLRIRTDSIDASKNYGQGSVHIPGFSPSQINDIGAPLPGTCFRLAIAVG